ncbi:MAG: hypothetical protein WAS51_14610 [Ilumatobacteraceae bacterium]
MSKKPNGAELRQRAVLVEINLNTWQARTRDTSVASDAGTDAAIGYYVKNLLDASVMQTIMSEVKSIRRELEAETLPWTPGARLLPVAKWREFQDIEAETRRRWNEMIDRFLDGYESHVKQQKKALGKFFNADDYPTRADVRDRFSYSVQYHPLPSSEDYSELDIPKRERSYLQRDIEAKIRGFAETAVEKYRSDLRNVCAKLHEQITNGAYGVRAKSYDYLRDLVDSGDAFNVTGDANLTKAIDLLRDNVAEIKSSDLRSNDGAKERAVQAIEKADKLLRMLECLP